jgi:hypothetical protein
MFTKLASFAIDPFSRFMFDMELEFTFVKHANMLVPCLYS